MNRVDVQPGEQFQLLPGFERFTPGVQQRLDRFEILFLQLDVSGDRHCAEPVMTVGQFRRFAKFRHRLRPPLRHLSEFRLIRQRFLDDLPLDGPLRDVHRGLRLLLPGHGGLDVTLVSVPEGQRHRDADADLSLTVARVAPGKNMALP